MMDAVEVEQQPIMFSSPASALGWADAIIAVGRCDSQMHRIMRNAVEQGIRATGGATLEDLRCEAHDISNALRDVQPYENACVYRHLFGLPSRHETVHALLTIGDGLEPETTGMRRVKLRALALAALDSERQGLVSRRFFSLSRYARSVGVAKQTFSESCRWLELRTQAIEQVKGMSCSAEKVFGERLRDKGVV